MTEKRTQQRKGHKSMGSLPHRRIESGTSPIKKQAPRQRVTRSLSDTQLNDQQLLQAHLRHMRWFYAIAIFVWSTLWMIITGALLIATKNPISLSALSGLATSFLFPRRLTGFLFPMDENDRRIKELEIQARIEKARMGTKYENVETIQKDRPLLIHLPDPSK